MEKPLHSRCDPHCLDAGLAKASGVAGMASMVHRFPRPMDGAEADADAGLVARAQSDRAAFADLYLRHFGGVYGYCLRALGGAERAEDAAQQVFEQALAALPRYREAGRFRSWLYAIAFRVIGRQVASDRRTLPLDAEADLVDPAPSPEAAALVAIERQALRAAIARLPADQRRVVELRLAGLSGREIAAELGRSHAAVRMLQQRAIDRLGSDFAADRTPGGRRGP
jgi:RNA polymerase sigma-70 factor (ECF subfamily)